MLVTRCLKYRRWLLPCLVVIAAAGCQRPPGAAPPANLASTAIRAPSVVGSDVVAPPGIRATRFGAALQEPAGLALDSDGALTTVEWGPSGVGRVMRLIDGDGDGQADQIEPLATNLPEPRGLAWLTLADRPPVLLVATSAGLMAIEAGQARLVGRLGDSAGQANDVAVGTDGLVYVTEGAAGAARPGAVWRFDPNALLTTAAPVQGERFATGMRNASGIAWSPSGAIYVTDNGEGWPFRADVADELNVLLGGGDYGWPEVSGQPPPDSGSIGPMALFPAGSDAGSLLFYSGRMFDDYAADLLVALSNQGKVVRVEIVSDAAGYHSTVSDFIVGFSRPTALAEGPAGELYVADAAAGVVYRFWR